MARKIIIDTDPGCDDAVMLAAALTNREEFDILGITSIGGNVDPELTQRNALGVCDLMGRDDIPVYAGCDRPLVRPFNHASDVHGESGVDGLVMDQKGIDVLAKKFGDKNAIEFLVEKINDNANDITLIVIGPMTNIARAWMMDPTISNKVKIVTMGGAYGDPTGNIGPDNCAEFNLWCDPHAAQIVYSQFDDITVFPLDVTHKTLQDADFREWLTGVSDQGQNFANMLQAYADDYPNMDIKNVSPLHDFHTVAGLLNPEIYNFEKGRVNLTTEGDRAGNSRLSASDQPNAKIALGIDQKGFFDVLKKQMVRAFKP